MEKQQRDIIKQTDICYFFSNFHLANITGQPGIIFQLAQCAAEKGMRVSIISNGERTCSIEERGIKIVLFKGIGNASTYFKNSLSILKSLQKINPRVIHVHGYLLSVFIFFLTVRSHARFVYSVCETPDTVGAFWKFLIKFVFKKAERVFVTAQSIKKELISIGIPEHNVVVSRIGLNPVFLSEQPLQEDVDILYFGDATKARGFDIVVDLARELPQYKFLLLLRWQGDCFKELKEAKSMANITVWQHPYREKLETLLKKTKLILLPYRWMGVRPPLTLVEAMASGKCVITSAMVGNEEIVRSNANGLIVDFTSNEFVIEIIDKLLKNTQQRNYMGLEAKKDIAALYAEKEYDLIVNTYKQIHMRTQGKKYA